MKLYFKHNLPLFLEINKNIFNENTYEQNFETLQKNIPNFEKFNIIFGDPMIRIFTRLYKPIFYEDYNGERLRKFMTYCNQLMLAEGLDDTCEYKTDFMVF